MYGYGPVSGSNSCRQANKIYDSIVSRVKVLTRAEAHSVSGSTRYRQRGPLDQQVHACMPGFANFGIPVVPDFSKDMRLVTFVSRRKMRSGPLDHLPRNDLPNEILNGTSHKQDYDCIYSVQFKFKLLFMLQWIIALLVFGDGS